MSAIDEAKDYFERIHKDKYLVINGNVTASVKALIKLFPELLKEIKRRDRVIDAAKKAFNHGIPDSYRGDDDDVGECAFCHGWNQQHEEYCKANALVEALSQLEDK